MSWQTDVLARMGAPATPQNISFLTAWGQEEGANSYYNPLNITGTTCSSYGAIGCFNSDGVLEFPNYQTGIDATVTYMSLPGFDGALTSAFQSGNALQYFQNHPAAAAQLRSAWSYGVGGIAKNMGSKYAPAPGAPNSAPSNGGWLQQFEGGAENALQDIEGWAGGIFGDATNWVQSLFGGLVSPFLRLPQSLINIGWNFGAFNIGLFLCLIGGALLFAAVFEMIAGDVLNKVDDVVGKLTGSQPLPGATVVGSTAAKGGIKSIAEEALV
jgi:hypothetical protein